MFRLRVPCRTYLSVMCKSPGLPLVCELTEYVPHPGSMDLLGLKFEKNVWMDVHQCGAWVEMGSINGVGAGRAETITSGAQQHSYTRIFIYSRSPILVLSRRSPAFRLSGEAAATISQEKHLYLYLPTSSLSQPIRFPRLGSVKSGLCLHGIEERFVPQDSPSVWVTKST